MLLLKTEKLPEGENWLYELKIDGYRSVALKPVEPSISVLATIETLQLRTLGLLEHFQDFPTKQ